MSRKGNNIHLTQMSNVHLENTYRWLSQSNELRRQVDCLDPPTPDGNRNHWHEKWKDPSREDYAIETADGHHIGNCGLCEIDRRRGKAQLWIYIGESRGNGYGTAAVMQLLWRGFRELGLHRMFLRVVADNPRALAFYRKLGFVEEGRFRQDTPRDGNLVDSIWMGLLAPDYASRNDLPEGGP